MSGVLLLVSAQPKADELEANDQSQYLELSAGKIQLIPDSDRLVGSGDVRLSAGEFKIKADLLFLDLNGETALLLNPLLFYRDDYSLNGTRLTVNLKTSAFTIWNPEMRIRGNGPSTLAAAGRVAHCEDGACRIEVANATACPHRPAGYRLRADEVIVREGGDLDLVRPVLEVDGAAVAAAPWLRLRTGNVSGFLPPRLGWDSKGGLVAGPAGRFPLGEEAFAEGHVAVRTSQGFETRTAVHAEGFVLSVDHLFDAPQNTFRFGEASALPLNGTNLNSQIDVVTDGRIIDDLAASPMDRAVTHTSSRALLAADTRVVLVETGALLLQSLDPASQLSAEALTPSASVGLDLPTFPILQYFWPTASVRFTRFGISSTALMEDASGRMAPGHSRLEAEYGFAAPGRAGPVAIGVAAAGRNQAWLADSTDEPTQWAHLASAEAHAALPLGRRYSSSYHRIEPFIRYRITPWLEGGFPFWTVDDFDSLRRGQGMEVGLSTALTGNGRVSIFDIDLWERISLPGFGADAGLAYLAWSATAGPEWLALSMDGSLDHDRSLPSTAGVALSSRHEQSSIEMGGRWVGPGRGPHLDQPFAIATGPWLASGWPQFQREQLEIFEDLKVQLNRRMAANVGARVGAWPDKKLHALWYGLELRSSCGCLAAQITASHRLDSAVPDVMTVIKIEGL